MKKQIEFNYTENNKPVDVVRRLLELLNITYHHHYITGNGVGVLEYFDK